MPSSYTSSLRLVLPVTGELTSIWGDTVNNGLTKLVEDAIAGTASVAMGDANVTLTTATEAADQARCMFITLTGALTAQRNVVCPSQSKLYFVTNNTTGGFGINFKTSAGAGIIVAPGARVPLYCNGVDVLQADTRIAALSSAAEIDVASAATTTIGGLASNKVRITGTTGISSLGTVYQGPVYLRFAGELVLTASASLVTPNGLDMQIRAGDVLVAWPKATTGVADGWLVQPQAAALYRLEATTAFEPGVMREVTAGFTLNTGLKVGAVYTIYNNSASAILVTQGAGLTMRLAGSTSSGSVSLQPRGIISVWVRATAEYLCSGHIGT